MKHILIIAAVAFGVVLVYNYLKANVITSLP